MFIFRKVPRLSIVILLATSLAACSTPLRRDIPIIYPEPPEEPRIVYLRSTYGEVDFRRINFLDYLFGFDARSDLSKPYGVVAKGDRVYISLTGAPSICFVDTKEQKVGFIGDKGKAKLGLPLGLAISKEGLIYAADAKSKRIFAFNAAGDLKVAFGGPEVFKNPSGIAINDDLGRIYVIDSYGNAVHVFGLKGETQFSFGKSGAGDGEFNFPSHIAIDRRNGSVYVVDTQNFRVQVFDKDGKFLRKFGRLGDQAGDFSRPKGIGIDSEGHVYVADAAFDNFQIFDEEGKLLMFIGGAGVDSGYFQVPAGIYVDENDRIYVVDSLNARVQVFQYLSEKWKRANPGEYEKYRFNQAK